MTSQPQAILLVEDNLADADLLAEILTEIDQEQWVLTHVERLKVALQYLSDRRFDVVLLDLSLPDSHGLNTLETLQCHAPNIPIVVLTGNDDKELALRAVARGAQDYLVKGQISTELIERAIRYAIERKQIVRQLHESERRFRGIFEQTFQLIQLLTPEGIILEVNQTIAALCGIKPEDCIGKPLWEVESFKDSVETQESLRTAIANAAQGQFVRYEVQLRSVEDAVAWMDFSIKPLKDESGKVVVLIAEGRDISDRKLAETEIIKALEQERELNRLKSQFVAMVSHEFRNPLTTIRTSADLLQSYNHRLNEEKKSKYFEQMQTAISSMIQLLDEVLLIGKDDAGKLQYSPAPLDLTNFCHHLTETLHLGATSSHKINFTSHGECHAVEMDEFLLRHIFTNLLCNAIKYSPDGGNIWFELLYQPGKAIFRIRDEGIGIPLKEQQRLFESFHRCTNVGRIKGTGLGLSIVKKCVDLHGGQIEVESEVGVGTLFIVTLPLKNCEGGEHQTNARTLPPQATLQRREFTGFSPACNSF